MTCAVRSEETVKLANQAGFERLITDETGDVQRTVPRARLGVNDERALARLILEVSLEPIVSKQLAYIARVGPSGPVREILALPEGRCRQQRDEAHDQKTFSQHRCHCHIFKRS